jgi:DNA replication protein DnaC
MLIDEPGYIPFEREATDLPFQVISRRYERESIAFSTNPRVHRLGESRFPIRRRLRLLSIGSSITVRSSSSTARASGSMRGSGAGKSSGGG